MNIKEIPMEYLDKIIASITNIEKLNMLEIVQHVYRSTYLRYSMKFYEEKAMREKVEGRMLEKNKQIEDLQLELAQLKEKYGETGIPLQEERQTETI